MLLLIKVIVSALVILVITEVAKKSGNLAGIIAVLPINIILSLLWINFETKDVAIINQFIHAAFKGIIPLIIFLSVMFICHKKNIAFEYSFTFAIVILLVSLFVQHKVIT